MEGRWNLCAGATGDLWTLAPDDVGDDLPDGYSIVPVVPCDDAAIERGGRALAERAGDAEAYDRGEAWAREWREDAEAVLRAAGETP